MARGTLVQKIIAAHLVSGDPAKDSQLLIKIDRLAEESNYSRNGLINLMLTYGVEHVEIE